MDISGNITSDGSVDFRRFEPLVEGGNSKVYSFSGETPLVRGDSSSDECHVIKIMCDTETNRTMYRTETKVYQQLERNSMKISPRMISHGTINRNPYIILEKAELDMLYLIMDTEEGSSDGPKIDFCRKCLLYSVIQVVMDLHANLIAHMDIKPENILISKQGQVWLCDFGCSVICKSPYGSFSGRVGTDFYSAPEMDLQKSYNPFLADIWSVTMLCYVMLTGVFPYNQQESTLLSQKIDVISRKNFAKSIENTAAPAQDKAFLKRIIIKKPVQRKTLAEISQDPWFDCEDYHPIVISSRSDKVVSPVTQKRRRCVLS